MRAEAATRRARRPRRPRRRTGTAASATRCSRCWRSVPRRRRSRTPLAWWGVRGLVAVLPAAVPRLDGVRMDAGVAAFVVCLPLVMTAIASLPAILFVRRGSIVDALAHGSRRTAASARGRRVLVVAQVALAVAIVAAAGVLVRGLVQLRPLDTGLSEDRLLFAELSLSGAAADRARHAQVLDAVVARVLALPGVVAATPDQCLALRRQLGRAGVHRRGAGCDDGRGEPGPEPRSHRAAALRDAGRAQSCAGGPSRPAIATDATRVAIVSEDVATRTWPGADPIGRRLKIGGFQSGEPWLTVVGVAGRHSLPRAGRGAADALPACCAVPRHRRAAGDSHGRRPGVGRAADPRSGRSDRSRDQGAARRDLRHDRRGAPGPTALSRDPVRRLRHHGGARWRRSGSTPCWRRRCASAIAEIAIRVAVGATPSTIRRLVARRSRRSCRDRSGDRRGRRRGVPRGSPSCRCRARSPTIRWRWPSPCSCCWRPRRWRRTGRPAARRASIPSRRCARRRNSNNRLELHTWWHRALRTWNFEFGVWSLNLPKLLVHDGRRLERRASSSRARSAEWRRRRCSRASDRAARRPRPSTCRASAASSRWRAPASSSATISARAMPRRRASGCTSSFSTSARCGWFGAHAGSSCTVPDDPSVERGRRARAAAARCTPGSTDSVQNARASSSEKGTMKLTPAPPWTTAWSTSASMSTSRVDGRLVGEVRPPLVDRRRSSPSLRAVMGAPGRSHSGPRGGRWP